MVKFIEKVEQCGRWPQQASTTMFFQFHKQCHERAFRCSSACFIGRCPRLRSLKVERWQERHHVSRDAWRDGWVERTAREMLREMKRFDHRAGEMDQGAMTLVPDVAKAFERVSLSVVWAWATHFNFPTMILRVQCGSRLKDVWPSPSRPSRPSSLGRSGAACSCALRCKMHCTNYEGVRAS